MLMKVNDDKTLFRLGTMIVCEFLDNNGYNFSTIRRQHSYLDKYIQEVTFTCLTAVFKVHRDLTPNRGRTVGARDLFALEVAANKQLGLTEQTIFYKVYRTPFDFSVRRV